jgi:hypothetical protein
MEPNGRVSVTKTPTSGSTLFFRFQIFDSAHGEELVKESFRWPIEASASRFKAQVSGAHVTPKRPKVSRILVDSANTPASHASVSTGSLNVMEQG